MRRLRWSACVAVACLLVGARLQAGAGSISGRITAEGGTPLLGVQLSLYTPDGSYVTGAPTDGNGDYVLGPVADGTYILTTNNQAGYIDEVWPGVACGGCGFLSVGTPIAVAGGNLTGYDFALQLGARFSGQVLADGGAAVSAGAVHVYADTGEFRGWASIQPDGSYLTTAVPAGTYRLRTWNDLGYIDEVHPDVECLNCTPTSGTLHTAQVGQITANINFLLSPGGRFSGTITSLGVPVSGVSVAVYSASGTYVGFAGTRPDGTYTTSALPTGQYRLRTSNVAGLIDEAWDNLPCVACDVTVGTLAATVAGAVTTGVDFDLAVGGKVHVAVTDTGGAPLPGVHVSVLDAAGVWMGGAASDASGVARVERGLPAGSYYVRTHNTLGYLDEQYDNQLCLYGGCTTADGTPVVVNAGGATSITMALALGNRIEGTVTTSSGQGVSGVNVMAWASGSSFGTGATTGADGRYVISGLVDGTYYLHTSNSVGYINESYGGATCQVCSPDSGAPLPLSGGTTAVADFVLDLGGTVSGVITNLGGTALSGVHVNVMTSTGQTVGFGFTDVTGRYVTSGLSSGSYYLRTFNTLGYVDELYSGFPASAQPSTGTPVVVVVGSQSVADFQLAQGATVTGTVTGAGAPLAGVHVTASNTDGMWLGTSTTTASGQFEIRGLPAGPVYVRTFNSLGFVDELYDNAACPNCQLASGTQLVLAEGGTATANFDLQAGARVAGTVRDAATGVGIPGVSVQVYSDTGQIVTAMQTDGTGAYTTYENSQLLPGTYRLRTVNAAQAGYVDQIYQGLDCAPTCPAISSGTPLALAAGVTTVDFNLTRGLRITGTLRRSDTGTPVGGSVQVLTPSGQFVASGFASSSGPTAGQYAVTAPPGQYLVRTSGTGMIDQMYNGVECLPGCNLLQATLVTTESVIDFNLSPGATVSGRVTSGGVGLNGVTVLAYSVDGVLLRPGTTATVAGIAGVYSVGGLPNGPVLLRTSNNTGYLDEVHPGVPCALPCNITAVAATPVTVALGAPVTGIDFDLELGGMITGVVRRSTDNTPVLNSVLRLFGASGQSITSTQASGTTGAFTFRGLPTGTYYVVAGAGSVAGQDGLIAEAWNDVTCSGCSPLTGTPIAVTLGQTVTGIDFALESGDRLSGRVTINGSPGSSFSVVIFGETGLMASLAPVQTNATTGEFTTRDGFAPGTYYARATSITAVTALYGGVLCVPSCVPTAGAPITVVGGQGSVGGIDIDLIAGGRITGAVTTAAGIPVGGVQLQLVNSAGVLVTTASTNPSSGVYQTATVPAGTYYLVTQNSVGHVNQVWPGVPCVGCDPVAVGTPVVLAMGQVATGFSFTTAEGGRFEGHVTNGSGAPLQGVVIEVVGAGSGVLSRATTNAVGFFRTGAGLPAGTFTVRTVNSLGYANQSRAEATPGSGSTAGVDFTLMLETDTDGDGIDDGIDRHRSTGASEATVSSADVNDGPVGGATSGSIIDRGGWTVRVTDQVSGVRVTVSGAGTSPVALDVCSVGAAEQVRLFSAGDDATVVCHPTTGSTYVFAHSATAPIELSKTVAGVTTVVQIPGGHGATLGSPAVADAANQLPLTVLVVGGDGTPWGAYMLDPGEAAEATVSAQGTLLVTATAGSVTATILGTTTTVTQGDVAEFDVPIASPPLQVRGEGFVDQGREKVHFTLQAATMVGRVEGQLRAWITGGGRSGPSRTFEASSVTGMSVSSGQVTITGQGTWAGAAGFSFTAVVSDAGGPGRGRDHFALTVTDAQGRVVLQASGALGGGQITIQ